jgi:hypothetical protein
MLLMMILYILYLNTLHVRFDILILYIPLC